MERADILNHDAKVARMLGRNYDAALLYAKAIEFTWNARTIPGHKTGKLMLGAAIALADCGLYEDAFCGIRMLTMAYIKNGRVDLAVELMENLSSLCAMHASMVLQSLALSNFVNETKKKAISISYRARLQDKKNSLNMHTHRYAVLSAKKETIRVPGGYL